MKFFIINLKRSTQRKENLQKAIKDLFSQNPHLEKELEFHFFEAVDAKNNEHLAFKEYLNDFGSKLIRGGVLGDSEKACFASHLSLWKKCLELNEPIFILEDDITFSEHFAEFILEFKHCPYEYVRLMSLKYPKTKPLNKHFELSFHCASGMQGYYLKPSAALKLLSKAKFTFAVDDFIDRYYFHKVFIVIFKPHLIDITSQKTTITVGKKTTLIRIQRTFLKAVYQCYGLTWTILNLRKIKKSLNSTT